MRKFPEHHKNKDGSYGPTNPINPSGSHIQGHCYKCLPYHRKTAKKQKDKTRWCLDEDQEYEVFRYADEALNIGHSGEMYAVYDNANEILGKNNERVAKFPKPQNEGDPWHGYPTDDYEFDDELLEAWVTMHYISESTRKRLMKGVL